MAETTPSFDGLKHDFPILDQDVNGKPLVYLDSAASSQKPQCVLDAIEHYYLRDNANVHRGAHTLGDRATQDFEGARDAVRAFINARNRKEIIWTKGTTEAINLLANTLGSKLQAGDEIIVSRMEHHANIVPWQMLAERIGAHIKVWDITPEGELVLDQWDTLVSPKTRILALTHVSNVLGTVNPIEPLIKQARERGIITVIDGAQAVPHFAPDVQALDCDFYAFSSHKLFGPTGLGVLYGREELLETLPPYQGGGEMIERVSFSGTTYNELPYRFEAGTPAISQTVGLHAALKYLAAQDTAALEQYESRLLEKANALVPEIPGMRVIGTAKNKVPVMSFLIEGLHPSDIGTLLDQQGIGIRTGHHCAMPLMEFLGVPGTARASFAFYNSISDVERLFEALAKIQRMFT